MEQNFHSSTQSEPNIKAKKAFLVMNKFRN